MMNVIDNNDNNDNKNNNNNNFILRIAAPQNVIKKFLRAFQ